MFRRLNALAMMLDGFLRFWGIKTGLNLKTARLIARENWKRIVK